MFIVAMTELNQKMYQLISREGKIKERLEIATILNKCIAELISGEDEDAAIFFMLPGIWKELPVAGPVDLCPKEISAEALQEVACMLLSIAESLLS